MTSQSIKSLATSLVFIFLMMVCANLTTDEYSLHEEGIEQLRRGMRWASVISILASVYYLNYQFWRRCYRRDTHHRQGSALMRHSSAYSDLPHSVDSSTVISSSASLDDDSIAMSSTEIVPELTTESIWVHAYGWGVLIFVTLYCLPGIYMQGACWWCLGMLVLSIDELIMSEVNVKLTFILCSLIVASLVSLWWGIVGMDGMGQTLGEILAGVVGPALAPFTFFSVRSNVRNTVKDIPRIFEFAAPFVVVMAVFIIATTPQDAFSHIRRGLLEGENSNSSSSSAHLFHETYATFSHTETLQNFTQPENPVNQKFNPLAIVPFTAFFFSPMLSGVVMYLATSCAISGHATEFVVALVINLAGMFCFRHGYDTTSAFSFFPAALALILLLVLRRVF